MVSPKGHTYENALKFIFKASNNEVEYEALSVPMELCYALRAERVRAFSDSKLLVSQVKGEYKARDVKMVAYLSKVNEKSYTFKKFTCASVKELIADSLLKLASSYLFHTGFS